MYDSPPAYACLRADRRNCRAGTLPTRGGRSDQDAAPEELHFDHIAQCDPKIEGVPRSREARRPGPRTCSFRRSVQRNCRAPTFLNALTTSPEDRQTAPRQWQPAIKIVDFLRWIPGLPHYPTASKSRFEKPRSSQRDGMLPAADDQVSDTRSRPFSWRWNPDQLE
jgi:hypothetical protein